MPGQLGVVHAAAVALPTLLTDLADLVLGRCCLGCGVPAPGLCGPCQTRLRGRPFTVTRPGMARPTWVAAEYSGLARAVVLAYKQEGYHSLAPPLGVLLADAVRAAVGTGTASTGAVTLVRVPGHRRPERGFDALGAVCREACRALAAAGLSVTQERLLRTASDYRALKGLDRAARSRQVIGAFVAVRMPARDAPVVVVDDVITTGATVHEAVAALERAQVRVTAVAAVAATPARR